MRRIADPQGRLDEAFAYGTAITVHPHVFRSALGEERGIIEYQVHQTARGARIDIVTDAEVDTARLGRKIEAAVATLGVDQPQVDVVRVATVQRLATGKLRQVVPLPR